MPAMESAVLPETADNIKCSRDHGSKNFRAVRCKLRSLLADDAARLLQFNRWGRRKMVLQQLRERICGIPFSQHKKSGQTVA
jgi:hypothetical protein